MDSISNLITNKANSLFESGFADEPAVLQPVQINDQSNARLDNEILNLENEDVIPSAVVAPNTVSVFNEPATTYYAPPAENISPISSAQTQDLSKLKTILYQMKDQIDVMLRFVSGEQVNIPNKNTVSIIATETGENVIEGKFNGEKMIGPDGKDYAVPPNYASKSKLVEGDIMKLTITNSGRFIYKQISPIEKQRLIGELISDQNNEQWCALANGKTYKLLTASVTFYKGMPGDDVVFFIPKNRECSWGAVENIIHKHKPFDKNSG